MFSIGRYKDDLIAFKKNWGFFLGWGILLVILGILAISFATLTTILSILVLGFVLLGGGIVMLIDTFQFWLHKKGFWYHLVLSILYIIVGIMFIRGPIMGSLSLTLLLGILFLITGAFRICQSFNDELPYWGWRLFNGIITLILGILILAQWPTSGLFIIGLFVGIDLIMAGWVYIMASLTAHSLKA